MVHHLQKAYEIVAKKIAEDPTRYHNVHYYNHAVVQDNNMVGNMLKEQVFIPFQVPQENIHLLDYYDLHKQIADIEVAGGLDLEVLGLGADCHFCVNMPDSTIFDQLVYSFDPKQYAWYEENAKAFGLNEVKNMASFGFKMINKTKRVVMIINGAKKAQAVKNILTLPVSNHYPGTILRYMDNLTLILDQEAASLLTEEDIKNVSN